MAPEEVSPEAVEPAVARPAAAARRGNDALGRRSRKKKKKKSGKRVSLNENAQNEDAQKTSVVCLPPPLPPGIPEGEGALLALAVRGGKVGARVWLRRVGGSPTDDVPSFREAFVSSAAPTDDAEPQDVCRDASLLSSDFQAALEHTWWVVHRAELALPEGVETWVFDAYVAGGDARVSRPNVAHQTLPGGDRCEFRAVSAHRRNSKTTTPSKQKTDKASPSTRRPRATAAPSTRAGRVSPRTPRTTRTPRTRWTRWTLDRHP